MYEGGDGEVEDGIKSVVRRSEEGGSTGGERVEGCGIALTSPIEEREDSRRAAGHGVNEDDRANGFRNRRSEEVEVEGRRAVERVYRLE